MERSSLILQIQRSQVSTDSFHPNLDQSGEDPVDENSSSVFKNIGNDTQILLIVVLQDRIDQC